MAAVSPWVPRARVLAHAASASPYTALEDRLEGGVQSLVKAKLRSGSVRGAVERKGKERQGKAVPTRVPDQAWFPGGGGQ